MRTTKIVTLATLLLAGTATAELVNTAGKAQYYTSYEEGLKAAAQANQPMALKFFTEW